MAPRLEIVPTIPSLPVPLPATPGNGGDVVGALLTAGLVGFFVALAFIAVCFVFSAWLMGWWLRVLVRFHRDWLDREYGRARGSWTQSKTPPSPEGRRFMARGLNPDQPGRGPRDW
jgi:hypothetical protein